MISNLASCWHLIYWIRFITEKNIVWTRNEIKTESKILWIRIKSSSKLCSSMVFFIKRIHFVDNFFSPVLQFNPLINNVITIIFINWCQKPHFDFSRTCYWNNASEIFMNNFNLFHYEIVREKKTFNEGK